MGEPNLLRIQAGEALLAALVADDDERLAVLVKDKAHGSTGENVSLLDHDSVKGGRCRILMHAPLANDQFKKIIFGERLPNLDSPRGVRDTMHSIKISYAASRLM